MGEKTEAARMYRTAGIIIHPLSRPNDNRASPGKRPLLSKWQKLTTCPTDEEISNYFVKKDYNIGAVCGKVSDLMAIDVDWYIRGMWDDILKDVDTSNWVKQYRTEGRWHWLFRFDPKFELKHAKALGIDLLGESGNVVMAPSVHESGDVYRIDGDVTKRPHIPDNVISGLRKYLDTYQSLKTTLGRCRPVFKILFYRVFEDEDLGKDDDGNKIPNPLYHDLNIFRTIEGRQRTLAMCAELLANGGTNDQLMLFCMMAFGNTYNEEDSRYQISKIKPSATAKTSTIKADSILSQLYDPSDARNHQTTESASEELEKEIEKRDIEQYPGHIIEWANLLLEKGDAFEFIVDTWNRHHVGDRIIGEACACAVASTYMVNSKGLHIKPSGDSGKGKSDGTKKFLHLLPKHKKLCGSLSGKSMFYNPNLTKGTIIYTDDVQLNEDIVTTIKQSITNFQDVTTHNTVKKQEYQQYSIPPRISWWMTSVSGFDDDQMGNRFLGVDVDGSPEQDEKVFRHQAMMERFGITEDVVDDDVMVCRAVFGMLEEEDYKIVFPYTNCVEWNNKDNRRNFGMFMDILKSVAFYRVKQREKFHDLYLATIDDFQRAKEIYKGLAESNATNLTETELNVMRWISGKTEVDIKEVAKFIGKSETTAKYLLHGRNGDGGMLAKVTGLYSDKITVKINDDRTTQKNVYRYDSNFGINSYEDVVNIDMGCIEEEYKKFKEEYEEIVANKATITSLSHENHIKCDGGKSTTIDRIYNTIQYTITQKDKMYSTGANPPDTPDNHISNSHIPPKMCESVTDSESVCDSDVIACDSDLSDSSQRDKIQFVKKVCRKNTEISKVCEICENFGVDNAMEIIEKLRRSGDLLKPDSEHVKVV